MGLDVTAHRNVSIAPFKNWEEFEDNYDKIEERVFEAFVITDAWLDRISDLEQGKLYCAKESESGISYAYSYHSYIRNEVCKMIGENEDSWSSGELIKGSDFEEWLNFADNEGCISTTTCKKLYQDFKKWLPKAKELNKEWLGRYETWMHSFWFASENGAVEYH